MTALVIEFFAANQASIPVFHDKNVALQAEAFVFPFVCQLFSRKDKEGIALHFSNFVRELCNVVQICPTSRAEDQTWVKISFSAHTILHLLPWITGKDTEPDCDSQACTGRCDYMGVTS